MARDERPPGPLRARALRLRRAFGRTRPGRMLKRLLGREVRIPVLAEPDRSRLITFPGDDELPPELRDPAIFDAALAERAQLAAKRRTTVRTPRLVRTGGSPSGARIANVVLVSHCNFKGNSAFHVLAVANELYRRGLSPVIAVPDEPETVDDIGRPPFPVLTYDEARSDALRFPDGRGPDLVHAWTPRELVRQLTVDLVRTHGCRYVVHLEDNEQAVLSAEHGGVSIAALSALPTPVLDRVVRQRQAHPHRVPRFLEQSAGMSVLIERLLEFVPPGIPAAVLYAGFDEAVLTPARSREEIRTELRLGASELAIVYPGNIHMVNYDEMRSLYEAVALLRAEGRPVVLVKTGWGSTQTVSFPALGAGVRDLGWVRREAIPELLAAADILVQPGGPGPFNDYRFPSKLPEFLASGRPVVLPRANLGLLLRDGEEALVLEHGDAPEIAAAVARLADDPDHRSRIGAAGKDFALRELRWSRNVDRLLDLYTDVAASGRAAPPAWALDGADPPVKVVAIVPAPPTRAEASAAERHGVHGFCADTAAPVEPTGNFRFCVSAEQGELPEDPLAIRVGGRLLLLGSGSMVRASEASYAALLRKRVLRALLLELAEEAFVVVDARSVWLDPRSRSRWLEATRTALGDGIRQYFASRSLVLADSDIEQMLQAA